MDSVLSEIFRGLEAIEHDSKREEFSEKDMEAMYELEDELEAMMDEDMKTKFMLLMTMYGQRAAMEEEKCFIKGFRTAMRIVMDSALMGGSAKSAE